jgi:hypothetical protein
LSGRRVRQICTLESGILSAQRVSTNYSFHESSFASFLSRKEEKKQNIKEKKNKTYATA